MSTTDTRTLLATVLDSVTGLTGHTFRPATVRAGSAWPQWAGHERNEGDAFLGSWDVIVILGQDERAAINLSDQVLDELLGEIESSDVAFVQRAIPVLMPISGTNYHAIQVSVVSE